MAVTSKNVAKTEGRIWRRFKDGESAANYRSNQDKIFQASWTHKCPEYVHSTPPCQGSCPAGEDIRGYTTDRTQLGSVVALRDAHGRNLGRAKVLDGRLKNLLPTRLF